MFKKILRSIQQTQMRRAEYWQLMNMSDTLLKDIGLSRGEIKDRFYYQKEVNR